MRVAGPAILNDVLRRLLDKRSPAPDASEHAATTPKEARTARPAAWQSYLAARESARIAVESGDWQLGRHWADRSKQLHGKWRGYDPRPTMDFVLHERDKPEIDYLLLEGISDPAAVRTELLLGLVGWLLDGDLASKRLLGVTSLDELDWKSLTQWRHHFSTRPPFPFTWDPPLTHDPPDPAEEDDTFRSRISDQPRDALIALSFGPGAIEVDLLSERLLMTVENTRGVIIGLVQSGLARYPAGVAATLEGALTVEKLKLIGHERGLKLTGRKPAIVNTLIAHVPEQELLTLVPGDYVELAGWPGTPWSAHRRAFIDLWLLTLGSLRARQRVLKEVSDPRSRDVLDRISISAAGANDCAFCSERANLTLPLDGVLPDQLPPHHPGCRCVALARTKGYEELING